MKKRVLDFKGCQDAKTPRRQEVIGMIWLLFLFLFFVAPSQAHHIRGLPHYGYAENYPQIPTYEETRIVDDWQIRFSFIRIFETKHCDLAVYIQNLKTGKPYQGTVTFHVFGQREDPDESHPFDTHLDPTNTFRVQWVYEEDGIYILRLRFKDERKEYIEDFKMQMGKVGFNPFWIILPGIVVGILMLMIIIQRIREKR
jgi:hypothetical protein